MKPQATEQYRVQTGEAMTQEQKDDVCDVLIAILERLLAKGKISGTEGD